MLRHCDTYGICIIFINIATSPKLLKFISVADGVQHNKFVARDE